MNLQRLKNIKIELDLEFSENLKLNYGTWEYNQLAQMLGLLNSLIFTMEKPNGLIKANKIYKMTRQ
jgi:hypothetical protein